MSRRAPNGAWLSATPRAAATLSDDAIRQGTLRPFEPDGEIVICSYQFARGKAADVANTNWDIVVMDEAHRLRNVYKPGNVIASTLKQALADVPKLLLTATPLQNTLLELYGLVSIIDDQVFGDVKSFREQFADVSSDAVFATLKRRLAQVCQAHNAIAIKMAWLVSGFIDYCTDMARLD